MWVLSESGGVVASESPGSPTYSTLGFSLDAMATGDRESGAGREGGGGGRMRRVTEGGEDGGVRYV